MTAYAVSAGDIDVAYQRIRNDIHKTPVIRCAAINEIANQRVYFKCENLQRGGAFKFRGASNAIAGIDDAKLANGVVTHSSGNHAQALARAARNRGVTANIVMPSNAPAVKQAAVADYGGLITLCEPTLDARETTAAEIERASGATMVHPYDNAFVIAGQGTVALEILEQVDQLDAIIVPVGGGGLMSGICLYLNQHAPHIKIYGAEPTGADDAAQSLAAGQLIPQTNPNTMADGLLTSLGELTWPIIRDHVEDIITVEEEQIAFAIRLLFERAKTVVEPSGAVSLAALIADNHQRIPARSRVAAVISGGNVMLEKMSGYLQ